MFVCVCKYTCICADQRTTLGAILQVPSTLKKKKKKRPDSITGLELTQQGGATGCQRAPEMYQPPPS